MFENIDALKESREKSRKFTYNGNVIPADGTPDEISQKIKAICLESE